MERRVILIGVDEIPSAGWGTIDLPHEVARQYEGWDAISHDLAIQSNGEAVISVLFEKK